MTELRDEGPAVAPAPVPDAQLDEMTSDAGASAAALAAEGGPPRGAAIAVGVLGLVAWLVAVASGQSPLIASAWLCLPVAVAAAHLGRRGALLSAGLAGLLSGAWSAAMSGSTPARALLHLALPLLVGQVVALLVRQIREDDLRVVAALDQQRVRAVEAFAQRDALSSRLAHQAQHDALTGLPNRTMFLERLRAALQSDDITMVGVLFIDLDDFKIVNDSLGHAAGDELLVGVGLRLKNALREGDLVARFGGDEFAILLLNGGTPDQAAGVAKRLLGVLRAPFALGAGMASGQASGGLVVDSRNPDMTIDDQAGDLMRQADLAMYAAKAAGGGACIEFRDELQEAMLERLELQGEITQALIRDDFTVHYQPVVDLPTGRVVAVEALLRWHHPERGDIPPGVFIPIAERSGAIVPLGLWVLEQACLDLRLWDELSPDNELRIAVNVSARQLRDTAVGPQIARVLHRTKVDPRRLVLEVTESLLMDDDEAAAATLWQLRALGIRIAVDDFGTGYSSLSRLVDLPLDDLKIDQTFIAELERSGAGATIINAAIAMAHGLDLNVVAEGVENAEQLEFLERAGCDQAQGYLFSPPVPADAIIGMLRRGAGVAEKSTRLPGPQVGGTGQLPSRPSPTIIPSLPRHR